MSIERRKRGNGENVKYSNTQYIVMSSWSLGIERLIIILLNSYRFVSKRNPP
jgi:hypothetical protein